MLFPLRMNTSAAVMAGLLNLLVAAAVAVSSGDLGGEKTSDIAVLPATVIDSTVQHVKSPRDAVHRCYDPSDEFGPAPSVEDCQGAIKQIQAVQGDITVKLVEGCYKVWSGNCTGLVCPQRDGTSTISPALAAQYMADSVMTECISNGLRGWYLDRDYGVGVYLT
ncbi:hypothetical protein M426DRAFT_27734 [Hypoxylon sp. CI-4A]|nr:hypothetical protein M426DRAFT_27734 [Hypoxylon sp. CI-4A]